MAHNFQLLPATSNREMEETKSRSKHSKWRQPATLLSEGILEIISHRFCETLFSSALLSMLGMCSFFYTSSMLECFNKKRTWHCFVSASNSSTANFHTRRNYQLISFSSISFLNAPQYSNALFLSIFIFWYLRPVPSLPSSPTLINYLITRRIQVRIHSYYLSVSLQSE